MFPLSFTFVLILIGAIYGAPSDTNFGRSSPTDGSLSLGKLRITNNGKNEELIPISMTETSAAKTDSFGNVIQQLSSPCKGLRPMTKIPHPTDKNKYILCNDEFHLDYFLCPNHGEFDENARTCIAVIPVLSICEEKKPCLNGGECVPVNSTFKCNCGKDWSGDRCETPNHICATKPCGLNAECRGLAAPDYQQDYICICNGRKEYGPNCLKTVPNPCSIVSEHFFSFAFSPRIYIQCDGDALFFQPCGQNLFWNQEEKFCDPKRPTPMQKKLNARKLITKQPVVDVETRPEPVISSSNVEASSVFTNTVTVDDSGLVTQISQRNKETFDSFGPVIVNSQNDGQREISFAVNSQTGKKETIDQPFSNKFQNSFSSATFTSDPNQNRFKQWQTTRTENLPVEINTHPQGTQTVLTNNRREGWPLESLINRVEAPIVEQINNFKKVITEEFKPSKFLDSDFHSFKQVGIQGSSVSSESTSSSGQGILLGSVNFGPQNQGVSSGNQFSRPEFRPATEPIRQSTVSITSDNIDGQKVQTFSNQGSQRFRDSNLGRTEETQFVAGFAPSIKGDRETFVRQDQLPPSKFSSGNADPSLSGSETRTFATRVFADQDFNGPHSNMNENIPVETTTVFNRIVFDSDLINNRLTSNQQRFPNNIVPQQNRFNEQPTFRNEEQFIPTSTPTTVMPSIDISNIQFQTFPPSTPPTQRFSARPFSSGLTVINPTTNTRNPNTPLSWEEIIRMNKPTTSTTTTTTTAEPLTETIVDDEDEKIQATNFQDFHHVPGAQQGLQRLPQGQSSSFDGTTTQQMTFRQPGAFPTGNNRDQDTALFNDFNFQQRPTQTGNNQFTGIQNRQPTDDVRFITSFRNQQVNPNNDLPSNQQTEQSFSTGQRFNNIQSSSESTTVMNPIIFQNQQGNSAFTFSRPGGVRPQESRLIFNQFDDGQPILTDKNRNSDVIRGPMGSSVRVRS